MFRQFCGFLDVSSRYEDPERCFSMFGCGSGDAEPESEPEDLSDLEGQYDDDPSAMSRGAKPFSDLYTSSSILKSAL